MRGPGALQQLPEGMDGTHAATVSGQHGQTRVTSEEGRFNGGSRSKTGVAEQAGSLLGGRLGLRRALWVEAPGFQRDPAGPIFPDVAFQNGGFVRNARCLGQTGAVGASLLGRPVVQCGVGLAGNRCRGRSFPDERLEANASPSLSPRLGLQLPMPLPTPAEGALGPRGAGGAHTHGRPVGKASEGHGEEPSQPAGEQVRAARSSSPVESPGRGPEPTGGTSADTLHPESPARLRDHKPALFCDICQNCVLVHVP